MSDNLPTDVPTGYEVAVTNPEDELPRAPSLATITDVLWMPPHTMRLVFDDGSYQDSVCEYDNFQDVRRNFDKVVDN